MHHPAVPTRPSDIRPPLPPRVYPLAEIDEDLRFTYGLMFDVAAVVEKHGYPTLSPLDLVDLQSALFRLLYVGVGR